MKHYAPNIMLYPKGINFKKAFLSFSLGTLLTILYALSQGTFVFCSLDSIISLNSKSEVLSLHLGSIASQACLTVFEKPPKDWVSQDEAQIV